MRRIFTIRVGVAFSIYLWWLQVIDAAPVLYP